MEDVVINKRVVTQEGELQKASKLVIGRIGWAEGDPAYLVSHVTV